MGGIHQVRRRHRLGVGKFEKLLTGQCVVAHHLGGEPVNRRIAGVGLRKLGERHVLDAGDGGQVDEGGIVGRQRRWRHGVLHLRVRGLGTLVAGPVPSRDERGNAEHRRDAGTADHVHCSHHHAVQRLRDANVAGGYRLWSNAHFFVPAVAVGSATTTEPCWLLDRRAERREDRPSQRLTHRPGSARHGGRRPAIHDFAARSNESRGCRPPSA